MPQDTPSDTQLQGDINVGRRVQVGSIAERRVAGAHRQGASRGRCAVQRPIPCESGLGHTHIPHPPATAPGTLTPTAACKLLAVMLSGTGTMWVAVEAIEAVFYRAFVVVSGAEIVVAGWRVLGVGFAILSMRLCVTP